MVTDFMQKPIAAAIRTEKDFSTALRSDVDMVFLLHSNIMTVHQCVKEIHSAGKKAFIHVDFAEGIGKDRFGLEFLAKQGVDSHSVGTSVESIKISKPDIIEIMPGIVTKKIREFSEKVDMPIIAGGIVETIDEVRAALDAGAAVVSTGEAALWSMKV